MSTPALHRLRMSAGRVFLHFGVRHVFQRYERTADWVEQKETEAAAGSPVTAAASRSYKTVKNQSGQRVREEIWEVEMNPFLVAGTPLDDTWRMTVDGQERRLASVVLSPDETYYEVRLYAGS